jgi:hypothetical protein
VVAKQLSTIICKKLYKNEKMSIQCNKISCTIGNVTPISPRSIMLIISECTYMVLCNEGSGPKHTKNLASLESTTSHIRLNHGSVDKTGSLDPTFGYGIYFSRI